MIETGRETDEGGSPRPRPRKRAVRLTDEANALLKQRLFERWEAGGKGGRLTREARAELLGVSVSTADRILSQDGVDRNTLVLAFKSVGLDWDDSRCEYVVRSGDDDAEPKAVEAEVPQPKLRSRMRWILWPALILCLLAAGPVYHEVTFFRDQNYLYSLIGVFNKKMDGASEAFHAGNYPLAEDYIGQARKIALRLDSVEKVALARRIEADIAAAQGSLAEAKELYSEALQIRESMGDERSYPALQEALGDLETRTGDFKHAEIHLQKSLAGYQREKDPGGIAMAYRGLGSLAFERGQLDEASLMFSSAIGALQGKGPAMEKDIEARQALVLRERGRYADARSVLQGCLTYWVKEEHPRWIAKTRWQLATVEAEAGNSRTARQLLVQAKEGYQRVGDRAGVADCDRALKDLLPTHANSSSVSRTIGR